MAQTTIVNVIDYIKSWRSENNIEGEDALDAVQLKKFARDFKEGNDRSTKFNNIVFPYKLKIF